MECCKLILQGYQPADCGSPLLSKGGEKLIIKPPEKRGWVNMITYSELMQTISVIIAIAGFILNFVKVYHDIKKK